MKLYEKIIVGSASAVGAGAIAWRTLFPWIGYDFEMIRASVRHNKRLASALESLLIDKFEKHVANHPKKPFLLFEDSIYTYEFVDQMACKVANIARSWGLKLRDTVAIVITNEPAFVWTLLGLQKLGIAIAFVNHNLKLAPLTHSIKAANANFLIVGQGEVLLENVMQIQENLRGINIFVQGLGSTPAPKGMHSFDPLMLAAPSSGIDPKVRDGVTLADICCFIYTSGTTGNPKPVIIKHQRAIIMSCALLSMNLQKEDIVYITLPLYHSAGGVLGLMGVINKGATVVLRRKFSASEFWSDCCKYDVTGTQYIGELFRYLLAQPPSEFERQHKVKWVLGNGLRKDIWLDVNKRFHIPLIGEFYGATEAPGSMINIANKPGACGRMSPLLSKLDPTDKVLVKFDYGSAQPIRDTNGRCIKVKTGKPGLLISKVPDQLLHNNEFNVYKASKEVNEKKLVRGAFNEGDIYFNHGDVCVLDDEYFVYFHDRIGDTFRWKGENVSTTELANVITTLDFVQDANVYGVTIPGHDGRAGMVALTLNEGSKLGEKELKELYDHVTESLPEYAQPLFVRLLDQAIITGTFKQRKVELVQEGYDLNKVKDPLYFKDTAKKTFTTFTNPDTPRFLPSKL